MERQLKKSLLIAMVLGDGYIRIVTDKRHANSKPQGVLQIRHSAKQRDYLEHKADLLHSILGGSRPTVRLIDNSGYPGVQLNKNHRWFRYLRNWIYVNGVKTYQARMLNHLTPEGIAIWYMDDGNLALPKKNGKIHARRLYLNTHKTKEENQIVIDFFKEKYDIRFTQVLNRGWYRLTCGTQETKKFISLVEPFIIPSMSYKIDMKYL